ncbi:MAG TPA: PIN domain-containing protein [Kribbella sp.]|uniref:PIN domain-containing protein n=1 Tax=Kribbella sp. TaxID=1871183 RepID=UPI002D78F54F|nr:PIN domain-containing protein [Kribbella sp.]HET6296198.1 PIN domain-containing protein [Kribbella sp.]
MLVRLVPGANQDHVLATLRQVTTDALNLRSFGGTPQELYNKYSSWVRDSVRVLSNLLSPADIERLLLTRRYWALQATGGAGLVVAMRHLLDTEIEERHLAFEETYGRLAHEFGRWGGPGHLVVADTSVYMDHDQKFEDLEVDKILRVSGELVHLLIPIAVIDELDNLKRGKDRWRPGHTLAVLDKVLEKPTEIATMREAAEGVGKLTVEIVFDPPEHSRLPIMDEEIIDRALAVKEVARRQVTLITYDTSQSTRARARGLKTLKLKRDEWEDEVKAAEKPGDGKRSRRRPAPKELDEPISSS